MITTRTEEWRVDLCLETCQYIARKHYPDQILPPSTRHSFQADARAVNSTKMMSQRLSHVMLRDQPQT